MMEPFAKITAKSRSLFSPKASSCMFEINALYYQFHFSRQQEDLQYYNKTYLENSYLHGQSLRDALKNSLDGGNPEYLQGVSLSGQDISFLRSRFMIFDLRKS